VASSGISDLQLGHIITTPPSVIFFLIEKCFLSPTGFKYHQYYNIVGD